MNIIPAIDLMNRSCVRLKQGDFSEKTIYRTDVLAYAKELEASGARTIHLVDLDRAKSGDSTHDDIIQALQAETSLCLQLGGGLRSETIIRDTLDRGIDRVVIGSLLVSNPKCVRALIDEYSPSRFVLAVDVFSEKNPVIAVNGWQESTGLTIWDLLDLFSDCEGLRVLCTDIARDGMLSGPSLSLYQACLKRYGKQYLFQASGGVSSLTDLAELKQSGMPEVIVGKALFEKKFTLKAAIQEGVLC